MQQADIAEGRDLLVYLSDGRTLVVSLEAILHAASPDPAPVVEENPMNLPIQVQRDGAWKIGPVSRQVQTWFKDLCRGVYRKAVYCRQCGYEIGYNPECPECLRKLN